MNEIKHRLKKAEELLWRAVFVLRMFGRKVFPDEIERFLKGEKE